MPSTPAKYTITVKAAFPSRKGFVQEEVQKRVTASSRLSSAICSAADVDVGSLRSLYKVDFRAAPYARCPVYLSVFCGVGELLICYCAWRCSVGSCAQFLRFGYGTVASFSPKIARSPGSLRSPGTMYRFSVSVVRSATSFLN
jgi:hypothetical protein